MRKLIVLLFPLSVFFMMFDFLRVYPGVNISVYRILQIIALFSIIIFLLVNRSLKFRLYNPTFLFLIGFFFMILLSTFFSSDVNNSLFEASRLTQYIVMAFIMALFLKNVWREEYWIYLVTTMLLCGGIAGLSIITDYFGVTDFSSLYIEKAHLAKLRPFGILGEPNFAGGKLGIFLPFVFLSWRYYNYHGKLVKAFLALIVLFITLTAIFLTGSRMGGVIAGFSLLIFIFKEARIVLRIRTIFNIMLAFLLIGLPIFIIGFGTIKKLNQIEFVSRYGDLYTYIGTRGEKVTDFSLKMRSDFFVIGLKMFADHPVTGVGLGNYLSEMGRYGSYSFRYSHNTFISVLAETGLIGFVFFVGLFIQIGRNIYYYYRKSDHGDFYFYLGLSFINLIIMLFFLSDFMNKYFWGMFVALSMFWDYTKRYRTKREKKALL